MNIQHDEQKGLEETIERAADPAFAAVSFLNDILPTDTLISDYQIKGIISAGGFGTVYRAEQIGTGIPVAIKVLHPELITHDNDALRFKREVEVIRSLHHPNVIEVYDYGQLPDGRPYFVMELLSGETLEQLLLSRGRLTLEETMAILDPLASALDTAHAQFIIHRDLKPSNVFLCDDGSGRVVLLDFGVAKLLNADDQALTASRQIIGTLACMSPEQLLGQQIDSRSDVYAVGILAYAMITGKTPFDVGLEESDNPVVFLYARYVRPVPPSQHVRIDSALDAPLLRALAQQPEERPATVGEFVAGIKAAIRKANSSTTSIEGATECEGIAVHVEINVDSAVLEDPDEALLLDLENVLPIAASTLLEAGLTPVVETGNNLLAVVAYPEDPNLWASLRKRVVETVLQAHERTLQRSGRDIRITLTFVAATGSLAINSDGALVGGGLLEAGLWLPPYRGEGVLLSKQLTHGLDIPGRAAPEAPDFVLTGVF